MFNAEPWNVNDVLYQLTDVMRKNSNGRMEISVIFFFFFFFFVNNFIQPSNIISHHIPFRLPSFRSILAVTLLTLLVILCIIFLFSFSFAFPFPSRLEYKQIKRRKKKIGKKNHILGQCLINRG